MSHSGKPFSAQADANADTVESLWGYCTGSDRFLPKEAACLSLYAMLANKRQKPNGAWEPAPIVFPWSMNVIAAPVKQEIQLNLKTQIEWARDQGQLREVAIYLRSLAESEWHYLREF